MLNHLGLFEGIGGFSLAARWAGWETKGWVEINPFCQTVLKYHFPKAQGFSDIKKFSYAIYKSILRNRGIRDRSIDIITGGFPCQPYSSAGLRKGTDDPRHLWPNMLETIRQFKPTWVVGENVRGITNWNGGLVFQQVQTDLEDIGYQVQAFILPACSVGAPHRRDRVWFIAYASDNGSHGSKNKQGLGKGNDGDAARAKETSEFERCSKQGAAITANPMPTQRERQIGGVESKFVAGCEFVITYTKSKGSIGLPIRKETQYPVNGKFGCYGFFAYAYCIRRIQDSSITKPEQPTQRIPNWGQFPTQSPLCGRNDGFPPGLVRTPIYSRRKKGRFLSQKQSWARHRRESIQAYGNAIVPQVAYQIFKAINQYENECNLDR